MKKYMQRIIPFMLLVLSIFIVNATYVPIPLEGNNLDRIKGFGDVADDQDVIESTQPIALIYPVVEDAFILSSPFGPRLKVSDDYRYDFHRGIDIPGEMGQEILSVADGVIYKAYEEGSSSYPNGGNVVVIRHELDDPIEFHGETITRLYAVYMHLDSFGDAAETYLETGEKEDVKQGDVIGGMGQSGDTDFTHLHFEIRMQTTCSLEYQIENPGLSCADYGFDPHVNPMDFYVDDINSDQFVIAPGEASPTEVEFIVSSDRDVSLVDGILFEIYSDEDYTNQIYSKALSFNTREGFDATSTETLDDANADGFVVEPAQFNSDSEEYEITFKAQIPDSVWSRRDTIYTKGTLLTTKGELESVEVVVSQ